MQELFGEFPPHAGVYRAGTVDQFEREVRHAAAVLADRRVRGEEAGAQPGARLQITRPELLFVQGCSLLALPLDGPRRQPRDYAALEDKDQYHERYRHHHRARRLGPGICSVDRGEVRDHHRDRVVGGVEDEGVGEQELVPRVDERQDRRREHPWRRERYDDLAERLYRRRPLHLCGLFEAGWQFPEEGQQNPDSQRQREDYIRDDHGPVGVYDPHGRELDEQRSYDRHLREEADREDQRHYRALEAEAEPRYRVGADGAEEQADHRRRPGDDHAVHERLYEVRVTKDSRVVIADRLRGRRDARRVQELCPGRDAHPEDPQKREDAHQHEEHEEHVKQNQVQRAATRRPLGSRCASHPLLLRPGLHTEDLDEDQRDQERRHEDEDGCRVPLREQQLADPHALEYERAKRLQLLAAQHPEQVIAPVGVQCPEHHRHEDGSLK